MYNLDRHDAGNNRTSNANFPAITNKLDEHVHVKEELCYDKV